MTKKPTLTLTGAHAGLPSVADLVAVFRSLTGRDPSAQEIAEAEAERKRFDAKATDGV